MIGYLQGRVLKKSPDRVVLDVQGVGYEVYIPVSTYLAIERLADGETARLHIHTHVREDALALYGFATEREKELFEKLIAVGGIGPRLGRVILSGMPPDDLLAALAAGDTLRLASIPGVGKKTAERMVLELRDKVQALAAELPAREAPVDDELVSALVNLGYKRSHAERAVLQARRDEPEGEFPELLRASLKRLSRV